MSQTDTDYKEIWLIILLGEIMQVQDKKMYFLAPYYDDKYQVGQEVDWNVLNAKYKKYQKAKHKLPFLRSQREKLIVFREGMLDKARKHVDKNLPTRFKGQMLFESLDDCKKFSQHRKKMGVPSAKVYVVEVRGNMCKACPANEDEKTLVDFDKKASLNKMKDYWTCTGDPGNPDVYEFIFNGQAKILEIIDLE